MSISDPVLLSISFTLHNTHRSNHNHFRPSVVFGGVVLVM